MQILLLGATGRTGTQVLKELLARNHKVTALARNPESLESTLPNRSSNLTIIPGSPLNKTDISTALAASTSPVDAVITTLNPRRASDSPFAAVDPTDSPPRMMADSMVGVLAALTDDAEARRNNSSNNNNNTSSSKKRAKVVALSALGAGSSAPHAHCLLRLLFRHSNMRFTYEDHDAVEEELVRQQQQQQQAIPYVLVRPTRLVEEDGMAARVFDEDGTVGMMEAISRGAVARFLVDAAEGDEWDGKAPIIVG